MTDWCEKHDLMSKHRVTRYDEREEQRVGTMRTLRCLLDTLTSTQRPLTVGIFNQNELKYFSVDPGQMLLWCHIVM